MVELNVSIEKQAKLRKTHFPRDMAMQHFDNFYAKVYPYNWQSSRIALLSPHKYCAVVNNFGDEETTATELETLGTIDIGKYYKRHHKKHHRYLRRMEILKEKREKKIKAMAEEMGVDPSTIDPETVVVSDVSDSELKGLSSTGSEAEDFIEMFDTELEQKEGKSKFVNAASTNINLNDFMPATEMKYQEQVITDRGYFDFYQSEVDIPIDIIKQDTLEFPEQLKAYTYRRRDLSTFPQPSTTRGTNILNYYLMDGASLLPVLALGIQPNDVVADFCSAPGGKALAILQTLRPSKLVCNEKSESRMARLKNVINTYVPKIPMVRRTLELQQMDAKLIDAYDTFDKILVDVPCTNDRISVLSDDNNMFKTSRVKERIELPQEQCDILINAIRCLKPGGTLVYSTCSMSPIQNDGVVHMAFKHIFEQTKIELAVADLKEAVRPLRGLYRIHRYCRYGQQILPFLPSNFGPMYFCKIIRKS